MTIIAGACKVAECTALTKIHATGYCRAHHRRVRKYGHPLAGKPLRVNHGQNQTPVYMSWRSMHRRCYNPNEKSYSRYGGRGITVCDRWRSNFLNFLHDMGDRPSLAHSLDRINPDGNYEPGNCRWASRSEQTANQITRRNLSGFRGVCKGERPKTWRAKLSFENKDFEFRGLQSPEEAAWMYDQLALAFYGDYAHLNFTYERLA